MTRETITSNDLSKVELTKKSFTDLLDLNPDEITLAAFVDVAQEVSLRYDLHTQRNYNRYNFFGFLQDAASDLRIIELQYALCLNRIETNFTKPGYYEKHLKFKRLAENLHNDYTISREQQRYRDCGLIGLEDTKEFLEVLMRKYLIQPDNTCSE